jgi:hypothetical protein
LGGSTYRGLFGYTSGTVSAPAEIRDLEVLHTNTTTSTVAQIYAGGITGYAGGTSILSNCVTGGSLDLTSDFAAAGSTDPVACAGGFAGYIDSAATVENGRAALNLSVTSNGLGAVFAGGLMGNTGGSAGERVMVFQADIPGKLSVTKTDDGTIFAGGAAGQSQSGKLDRVDYSGRVSVNRNIATPAGTTYLGGITGRLENTSMEHCSFTGVLDIPPTDGSDTLHIGGLTGNFYTKGEIANSSAKGDISCASRGNGEIFVGGLAGHMQGSGDISRVALDNSYYSDGAVLAVSSGTGTIRVGGVTGHLMRYGEITNCHSLARSVRAWKTAAGGGNIYVGGFAGSIMQTPISGCSSASPVSVPPEHQGSDPVYIGGFVGVFYNRSGSPSTMEACYASGTVSAYGKSLLYAGGLIGISLVDSSSPAGTNSVTRSYATGAVYAETSFYGYAGGLVGRAANLDISESYASGAVTLRKNASSNADAVYAGGLAGFLGHTSADYGQQLSSITNCYALGNVLADNPAGGAAAVYAGGLAGYVQTDAAKTVQYNFAGGAVTAQSAGNGAVYAGGVAGYKQSGVFSHNAAFGEKITVKGGGTRYKGRIYADLAGAAASANHALNAMYLGDDASYYVYAPAYAVAASTDAASANGYDATFTAFRETSLWQTTLGFTAPCWNFAGLARGYPHLSWQ